MNKPKITITDNAKIMALLHSFASTFKSYRKVELALYTAGSIDNVSAGVEILSKRYIYTFDKLSKLIPEKSLEKNKFTIFGDWEHLIGHFIALLTTTEQVIELFEKTKCKKSKEDAELFKDKLSQATRTIAYVLAIPRLTHFMNIIDGEGTLDLPDGILKNSIEEITDDMRSLFTKKKEIKINES